MIICNKKMNGLFFHNNPVGLTVQLEKVHCYLSLLHFLTRHLPVILLDLDCSSCTTGCFQEGITDGSRVLN